MNPTEVIVSEVQRNSRLECRQLLRKGRGIIGTLKAGVGIVGVMGNRVALRRENSPRPAR